MLLHHVEIGSCFVQVDYLTTMSIRAHYTASDDGMVKWKLVEDKTSPNVTLCNKQIPHDTTW
jgi:hypothetical protein